METRDSKCCWGKTWPKVQIWVRGQAGVGTQRGALGHKYGHWVPARGQEEGDALPRKRGGKAERVMNTSFIFCLEFTFFWPKNSRHNNATVRPSPLVITLSRQHNTKYNVSQQDWSPQLWKDPLLSGPTIFSWFNSVSGKAY